MKKKKTVKGAEGEPSLNRNDDWDVVKSLLPVFSQVVNHTSFMVVMTDTQGKIKWVNQSFEKMTGYAFSEVKDKTPRSILQGKDTSKIASEYMSRMMKDGKPFVCEVLNYTKQGIPYWIHLESKPLLNQQGKIMGHFAIMREISKEKNIIQSLLRAREKSKESDQLKASFLTNISHEIRTPLNAIMGFSELLQRPIGEDKRKIYSQFIVDRGNDLLKIIDNILDISKIETRESKYYESEGNVEYIFQELQEKWEKEIGKTKKAIDLLILNKLVGEKNYFLGDMEKVKKILDNFLCNAIKFTHTGFVRLGCEEKFGKLVFSIEDSGIGIAPERERNIFKAFRKEEGATQSGTGLGLAVNQGLVEFLGGEVWYRSRLGVGSQFFFTLPYKIPKKISVPSKFETST